MRERSLQVTLSEGPDFRGPPTPLAPTGEKSARPRHRQMGC